MTRPWSSTAQEWSHIPGDIFVEMTAHSAVYIIQQRHKDIIMTDISQQTL